MFHHNFLEHSNLHVTNMAVIPKIGFNIHSSRLSVELQEQGKIKLLTYKCNFTKTILCIDAYNSQT